MQALKEGLSPITRTIVPKIELNCEKCGKYHEEGIPCGTNTHCTVCYGFGWVHPRKADGEPDYRRAVACRAEGCHQSYLGGNSPVIDYQGISRIQDFTNFVESVGNQEALLAAKSLASGQSDFIFLTVFGVTGNGKTHLANAVARKLQQEGQAVRKLTMMELLDYLQEGIKDDTVQGRIRELELVPFLAIDDIKVEYLTTDSRSSWNLERLEQIINYRYDALLPTFFTTNNQPEQLPARIKSRLEDKSRSRMIWNKAPDQRRKNA